jgi:hypothetical protein
MAGTETVSFPDVEPLRDSEVLPSKVPPEKIAPPTPNPPAVLMAPVVVEVDAVAF